jgi:hypothetical protein
MTDSLNKNEPEPKRVRGEMQVTLSTAFWVFLAALVILPYGDDDPHAVVRLSISTGLIVLMIVSEMILRLRGDRRR